MGGGSMLRRLLFVKFGIFYFFAILGLSAFSEDYTYTKSIQTEIIGQEIYALIDQKGFHLLTEDTGYPDWEAGEKYWIAIDSRYEYITLRTLDDVVVEMIVHNPDLQTERGISPGDSLNHFLSVYPEAELLEYYSTGVPRQTPTDYWIEDENIEVITTKKNKITALVVHSEKPEKKGSGQN